MKRIEIKFPCGNIDLEGVCQFPDSDENFPVVIICHPHPLHGGDLHNHVVSAISRNLLQRSIATLRFNFRGVGQSGGNFGEGVGEQEDLKAAIEFALIQENIDSTRLGLAGYSFGGGIVVPVAYNDERVKAISLISPALENDDWNLLRKYKMPKMLISGSNDEFFPFAQYETKFKNIPGPKQFQIVNGADHFWQNFEVEAAEKVGRFFSENLFSLA